MSEAGSIYAMGRTADERGRLSRQERVFAPHSENLFRQAGIGEGARVIDVGCGVGETTRLLARIVGPAGSVIGVDHDAASLEEAERAAADAGLSNVSFQQRELPDIELDTPVDALAGRLILIHLDDPASMLAQLIRYVRPGGIVAFQEITVSRARSVPEVPLMTECIEWLTAGLAQAARNADIGDQLPAVFRRAGLSRPQIAAVSITGDADSEIPAYVAQTLASLAPLIVARGAATEEEVTQSLFLDALVRQMRERDALIYLWELVTVWARVPLAN
jgi:SAM-dependent methyltransferase